MPVNRRTHTTTTVQMSHDFHTQLKMMCTLTKTGVGEFIRIAVSDKIKKIKNQEVK